LPRDASGCIGQDGIANKKTSFVSKVPEEAHSVNPLPQRANVTTLSKELLDASRSNIFSFPLLHGPLFHFYGKHELPFADFECKC